jgi:alpha-tubulin suppressor-like RCC1 family protein
MSSSFDFTMLVRLESSCYGKPSSDLSVCSGNGVCMNGICSCMINFSGNQCEFTTCFGKNSSETNICSGNGKCNEKDICTCNSGFGGKTCEFNYAQNPNTVVYAFGAGYRGQLGDGSTGQRTTPYPLSIQGVKQIFLGQDHTLMIKEDGKSYSTGRNDVRNKFF